MQRPVKKAVAAVAVFVGVLSGASSARAACVDLPALLAQHGWKAPRVGPGVSQIAYIDGAVARPVSDSPSIIGMWQFAFTSEGNDVAPLFIPDGVTLDQGYAQWHSDGTEIMNSSRDPATSNFCLGVYEGTGARTFRLNHFALSWDNTGQLCTPAAGAPSCFVGPTNIREEVTVDRQGMTYSGTVTIDQYTADGAHMFQLKGTVSGQRIQPE